ncbi:MAG: hypothetical protein OWR52_03705 [Acidibacillus sp.]|nr:hypothetical protein [Acidibacillus sp.]
MYGKRIHSLFAIIGISFLLSACGTQVKAPQLVPVSSSLYNNIQITPDGSAAKVPEKFYKLVTEGKLGDASTLLGPQLRFETAPTMIKYLKNIVSVKFLELRDISKDPGPIDPGYKRYYRIKIYYGVIDIRVANPNLVSGLNGINYRKFILIKIAKNQPWLMNTDEDTPKIN